MSQYDITHETWPYCTLDTQLIYYVSGLWSRTVNYLVWVPRSLKSLVHGKYLIHYNLIEPLVLKYWLTILSIIWEPSPDLDKTLLKQLVKQFLLTSISSFVNYLMLHWCHMACLHHHVTINHWLMRALCAESLPIIFFSIFKNILALKKSINKEMITYVILLLLFMFRYFMSWNLYKLYNSVDIGISKRKGKKVVQYVFLVLGRYKCPRLFFSVISILYIS